LNFVNYDKSYLYDCLKLFDANTPQFFAENERSDYEIFLAGNPENYNVGFLNEDVVAVFGISIDSQHTRGRITWIMVSPHSKGGCWYKDDEICKRIRNSGEPEGY